MARARSTALLWADKRPRLQPSARPVQLMCLPLEQVWRLARRYPAAQPTPYLTLLARAPWCSVRQTRTPDAGRSTRQQIKSATRAHLALARMRTLHRAQSSISRPLAPVRSLRRLAVLAEAAPVQRLVPQRQP